MYHRLHMSHMEFIIACNWMSEHDWRIKSQARHFHSQWKTDFKRAVIKGDYLASKRVWFIYALFLNSSTSSNYCLKHLKHCILLEIRNRTIISEKYIHYHSSKKSWISGLGEEKSFAWRAVNIIWESVSIFKLSIYIFFLQLEKTSHSSGNHKVHSFPFLCVI